MESKISMKTSVNATNTSIPLYSKDDKDLHVSIQRERAHQLEDLGLLRIENNKAYKNGA